MVRDAGMTWEGGLKKETTKSKSEAEIAEFVIEKCVCGALSTTALSYLATKRRIVLGMDMITGYLGLTG